MKTKEVLTSVSRVARSRTARIGFGIVVIGALTGIMINKTKNAPLEETGQPGPDEEEILLVNEETKE